MFGRVGCNLMCGHLLPIVSGYLGRKGYVFDCHGLWGLLELGPTVVGAPGTVYKGSLTMLTCSLLEALDEELPFCFSLQAVCQQEERMELVQSYGKTA